MRRRVILMAVPLLLVMAVPDCAFGLATEHIGPDRGAHSQPDWAHGLEDVVRQPSRVYSRWVNGNENFYFNVESDKLSELIVAYSRVGLRDHVVRVVQGEPLVKSFKGLGFSYNVNMKVLSGIALWHAKSTSDAAETYEPILEIHVATPEQQEALEDFDWPNHIIIDNELPESKLRSSAKKPARKLMHAAVNFKDGKPATDFEVGMTTTITLWEKDNEVGFNLGKLSNKGLFDAAFSLDEISRLKTGDMWLTMTVGNYLTNPAPDHPRLPVDNLSFSADEVKPVTVPRSAQYYGRLLFEDGSPPEMTPEAWPGSKIAVNFPFAGMVNPDQHGFFIVTLTGEQLKELKAGKQRKNIYVPRYESPGSSRAMYVFPIDRLKPKKENVVAVKIPKPVPPDTE